MVRFSAALRCHSSRVARVLSPSQAFKVNCGSDSSAAIAIPSAIIEHSSGRAHRNAVCLSTPLAIAGRQAATEWRSFNVYHEKYFVASKLHWITSL
jgi:hypothetical protein